MDNPQQQSGNQLPSNPVSPVSNSKSSKIIPICLGIVVVLVVAIGAYLLGSKQSQLVVQNSVQITPIPTLTPDPTANWKTYANTKYTYLLKYPATWNVVTDYVAEGDFIIQSSKGELVDVIGQANPQKLTIQEWLKQNWPNDTVEETVVGGKTALKNQQKREYYISYSNDTFIIISYDNCRGMGCGVGKLEADTFDQILSTFKFIQ